MPLINIPSVTRGMSTDELVDIVAKLSKQIQWLTDGNLDSQNTREIGGWLITADSMVAKTGDVGMSSASLGMEDIRFWSGNADPTNAPFRVYSTGRFVASDANITGSIHMGAGSTISWSDVTAPSASQVGAVPWNDPKLSNLNSIGEYIGALSTGQVSGLSSRLTNITSNGVYTGTVGTDQLVAGTALIGDALIGNLNAGKITAGTIIGIDISGANIYGSNKMYLSPTNFGNGLVWSNPNGTNKKAEIYIDSASSAMFLSTTSGGIYANGQRIDVPPTAKWS